MVRYVATDLQVSLTNESAALFLLFANADADADGGTFNTSLRVTATLPVEAAAALVGRISHGDAVQFAQVSTATWPCGPVPGVRCHVALQLCVVMLHASFGVSKPDCLTTLQPVATVAPSANTLQLIMVWCGSGPSPPLC